MKRYQLTAFGSANIRLSHSDIPEPGPGEILVAMKAASVNFRDFAIVEGYYSQDLPLPLVPLSDGAGVVTAVGPGVTKWQAGNRVATQFYPYWTGGGPTAERIHLSLGCNMNGALADYIRLPETGVVAIPDHLDFAEGATLPCAAVTAWSALVTEGGIRPGDKVLIQGTGGVSLFALQLAQACGAETFMVSSSDEKLERAGAMGARHRVNYTRTPDWGAAIRDLTGGMGVDLVVEIGGGNTLAQSLKALRVGGRISVIGMVAGQTADISIGSLLFGHVHLNGITVGSRDDFLALNRFLSLHQLHPVIDRHYPADDAGAAIASIARGQHFGKIVIDLQ